MVFSSNMNSECYFPPILGNGEISLAPDCEGTLNYKRLYGEVEAFDGIIVRCGRRSNNMYQERSRLFSFGKLVFYEGSKIEVWTQELLVENGCVKSECTYEDKAVIHSQCFIHPKQNIYALRKVFNNVGEQKTVSYEFVLEGFSQATCELEQVLYTECKAGEAVVGFRCYGHNVYTGEVRLTMSKEYTAIPIKNGFRLEFNVSDGECVDLFYTLEDNLAVSDYHNILEKLGSDIKKKGYDILANECEEDYRKYFDLGYVETDDQTLNDIYKTALYNLKCYTTKTSIPVGLNNGYWDGKYFAFDEYYCFGGLLGANRIELAKRVPTFRLEVCLDKAIRLGSDCHKNKDTEEMAKFFWVVDDNSIEEQSGIGCWRDHVFHIPIIGIGAYEYYEYTKDREFFGKCYRMIRACAKFFTKSMIYRDGGRLYLGKCTDLERLGAAVENPFMTSCGVIKLLEICAEASEILNADEDYRQECRYIAAELRKSLPVANGMYVPFAGCKQKSIGVFAGKYPFNALADDDEKLLKAWEDFEENGTLYGNMYPGGTGISSWYACWKAESYARVQDADKAYNALKQSYRSRGCFNELFEINDPDRRIKPWFTTAHGIFLSAVNEMLVQSDGKVINILPAMPEEVKNISFKLAVKGNAVCEVHIKDGKLTTLNITRDVQNVAGEFEVLFRNHKCSL